MDTKAIHCDSSFFVFIAVLLKIHRDRPVLGDTLRIGSTAQQPIFGAPVYH